MGIRVDAGERQVFVSVMEKCIGCREGGYKEGLLEDVFTCSHSSHDFLCMYK